MNKDILICGVGGQGTVLASKIIAAAAMEEGSPVHSAETIGMAQRGGSVTSHVRSGGEAYSRGSSPEPEVSPAGRDRGGEYRPDETCHGIPAGHGI